MMTLQRVNIADLAQEPFPHGWSTVMRIGDRAVGYGMLEPGWRWSQDLQRLEGTPSCAKAHFGYLLSGRLQIRMDDGAELTLEPGDLFTIPTGHDAWVLGDQPATVLEFDTA